MSNSSYVGSTLMALRVVLNREIILRVRAVITENCHLLGRTLFGQGVTNEYEKT